MPKALVIDDNKQTTEALVQMLQICEFQVRSTPDPVEAISILNSETPQIVFLDIHMPGVDGLDILFYLKKDKDFKTIPVVIVTSDDQPPTSKRALELGAVAVIIKPVMIDVLERCLKEIGLI